MRIHGFRFFLPAALLALIPFAQAQTEPVETRPQGTSQATSHVQENRVPEVAWLAARATLPGHVAPAWAAASADLGPLPDSSRVPLVFALSRAPAVQAAYDQLLADQQNPNSPRYHQWLTPAEIGTQFGPTQHDVDALTTWLTAAGFSVEGVSPSRTFVQASAPAAVVSAALATSLHRYTVLTAAGTETRQAAIAEPSLPAALAPIVAYIGGLTSIPEHVHSHGELHSVPAAGPGTLHPDLTTSGGSHFLLPADFNKIYDVPAAITGAGQRIAIIGGSRLDPTDLSTWESYTSLAVYAPNYIVGPGFSDPGQTRDDNMGEGTLDFERVYGTAPGAAIDQIIAANWLNGTISQGLVLYAINTVNDPVLSLSFGACEADEPAGYVKTEDSMYAQAAMQGITVLVSSGDSGVTGCAIQGSAPTPSTSFASISDICASSFVTCVGGTQFNDTANPSAYWSGSTGTISGSALGYIPEGGWNEPVQTSTSASGVTTSAYVVAASGGGPSSIIAKPAFQTGPGVPADGARDTPDISFSAASHDGYFSCLAYAGGPCTNGSGGFFFEVFGGTSATAPSMAGVAALTNQKLGGRLGNLNPMLYKLAAASPAAFHDATIATSGVSGCTPAVASPCNNSSPSVSGATGGVPGFLLETGYDLATGLGSLDVNAFLSAAAVLTLPATATSLTGTTGTITAQIPTTYTAFVAPVNTITTTPTGVVQFRRSSAGGSANLGAAITLVNSRATLTGVTLPAGAYTISAVYQGDTIFAGSTSNLLSVVSTPIASTTTLSGVPSTATSTTAIPLTVTVTSSSGSGTPTGPVQFRIDGAGNASMVTNLSGGSGTFSLMLGAGTHSVCAVYPGDSVFAPSTSTPCSAITVTLTVAAATITLAPASASLATHAGTPVTDTITLTDTNYAGLENLGCTIVFNGTSSANAPVCSINPTALSLPGSGTFTATLSLTSVKAYAVPGGNFASTRPAAGKAASAFGGAALCSLLVLCFPRRRTLRAARLFASVIFLLTTLFALSGCSPNNFNSIRTPGTTTGSYTVTVTAGSTYVSASTTVNLIIQ